MGWVFGYGSLVNTLTHDQRPAIPAHLSGWRREWLGTPLRPAAFLSVRRAPGARIAGMAAAVPGGDWAALDRREAAYTRHPVTVDPDPGGPVQVYAVTEAQDAAAPHPILMSYLDVVVEGFDRLGQAAAVAAFFATTDGWDRPVLNDRAAPRYPRHRLVGPRVQALTDQHLRALATVVEKVE